MEREFAMKPLHEVLKARRDEVLRRWKGIVVGTLAPESMGPMELVDHLPSFLEEVIDALRAEASFGSPTAEKGAQVSTAAEHGRQRLRLGFSLDAVVREYGALRDAIVATAAQGGASLSLRELQIVFDAIVNGIAEAVSEYSRQRDAELQRQHNEHFAFIAHELRNPLSAATMALAQLKRKGQLPPEERSTLALERGLKRMRELIEHSLDVARTVSGIELKPEPVKLSHVLEEAEIFASAEAAEKQIEIHNHIEQDREVHLDVRLVRSALNNLVHNAVKYSSIGGSVELRGKIANGCICIEIEDSCGGLPPGKVEEAFVPFVRLNNSEPGFGLGLAIAKQAVQAHGGAVRVQNLPGKGCVFALEFPVVDPAPPVAPHQ